MNDDPGGEPGNEPGSATAFDRAGGAAAVRARVDRFYDLAKRLGQDGG